MKDYYKILGVDIAAKGTEIKKRFRKLAIIHHPDKNAGSKKSEEVFKEILNAYETLLNKEKRATYDFLYRQKFEQTKTESSHQNNEQQQTKKKDEQQQYKRKQQTTTQQTYNRPTTENNIRNYGFWLVVIILALIYFFSKNEKTTTGNTKADKELEQQESANQPQSGELDFKK